MKYDANFSIHISFTKFMGQLIEYPETRGGKNKIVAVCLWLSICCWSTLYCLWKDLGVDEKGVFVLRWAFTGAAGNTGSTCGSADIFPLWIIWAVAQHSAGQHFGARIAFPPGVCKWAVQIWPLFSQEPKGHIWIPATTQAQWWFNMISSSSSRSAKSILQFFGF